MGIDACMFLKTRADVNEQLVLDWAYELCGAFPKGTFFIYHPGVYKEHGQHCLSLVNVYEQDGPDVRPEPGEHIIEVHLNGRYYGVGYERGELPTIIAVAQWLETRIPDASIYYGGDSSGILAEPFGQEERLSLWKYFVEHGNRPYYGGWGNEGFLDVWTTKAISGVPVCALCKKPTARYGFGGGGGYAAYSCMGCYYHYVTRDSGESWKSGRNESKLNPCSPEFAR